MAAAEVLATGIGSLGGQDAREAARVVVGELADLPHLPELPSRGPWSDITGRGVATLVDVAAEVGVGRWRLTPRSGRDQRRARSLLAEDLDAFEETAAGHEGAVKVQVCGPLTLAATLELRGGDPAIGDPGARRDLAASLAEGVGQQVSEVRHRLPAAARLLVQLDEPALLSVVGGTIPRASGYQTLEPVTEEEVLELLNRVSAATVEAGAETVLHTCALPVPAGLLTRADVNLLSFPLDGLPDDSATLDALARWFDDGNGLIAGVTVLDPDRALAQLSRTIKITGASLERANQQWLVSPECGLADLSMREARESYRGAQRIARRLPELVGRTAESLG